MVRENWSTESQNADSRKGDGAECVEHFIYWDHCGPLSANAAKSFLNRSVK
jgi:hypothetical protein